MFIKTKKACERLGIHPNTLRKWANQGEIEYVRSPGGYRMYDVDAFLKRKIEELEELKNNPKENLDNDALIIFRRKQTKS